MGIMSLVLRFGLKTHDLRKRGDVPHKKRVMVYEHSLSEDIRPTPVDQGSRLK